MSTFDPPLFNTQTLSGHWRVEDSVRASEAHSDALFMQAMVGLSEISLQGQFLRVNAELCRMLERSQEELLGLSVPEVTYPDDVPPSLEALGRLLETGKPQSLDKRYRRPDESLVWATSHLSLLRDEHGQPFRVIAVTMDMTQRKRDEDAVRNSEEHLRIAIEAGELGTWDWDIERNEIYWNERHFLLFGMTPRMGPVQVDDFASHVHPDDAPRVAQHLNEAVEKAGPYKDEFRIVREDTGEVRWMNGYGHTIEARDGRAIRMSGMMFDSTERRQVQEVLQRSHEELEQLVGERTHELGQALQQVRAEVEQRRRLEKARANLVERIVNAQEEERGRISRELHDNLGQHLTAVLLGLHALETEMGAVVGCERMAEMPHLGKLRFLVHGLMQAAHRQAWELRPAELDTLGLEVALQQYVCDWSERCGVRADFQAVGWQQRLDPEVETTFFRVVQEALTNVARHAQATQVGVLLELKDGTVRALIEDNGRGFDPEQSTGRLGVLGMKERLAIVGGSLEIESCPGQGTTVFAQVPVSNI